MKKKSYLFVCDDVEFWRPIIETVAKDYSTHIQNLDFEICDTDSIRDKSFSYFNDSRRIYTLNNETIDRIKKIFDIDNYKFHVIKLNNKKRKLEDVFFDALIHST